MLTCWRVLLFLLCSSFKSSRLQSQCPQRYAEGSAVEVINSDMIIDRCHGDLGSGLGEHPQVTIPFLAEFQDCKATAWVNPRMNDEVTRWKCSFPLVNILQENAICFHVSIEWFPFQACFPGVQEGNKLDPASEVVPMIVTMTNARTSTYYRALPSRRGHCWVEDHSLLLGDLVTS